MQNVPNHILTWVWKTNQNISSLIGFAESHAKVSNLRVIFKFWLHQLLICHGLLHQRLHRAELGRCVLGPKTVWTNSNRFNDALNKWRKGQFWLSNFKFSCFINPGYLFLFLKKTENKSSRLDLNIYKHIDVSSYEHLNFSVCISQTFRYPESSHKSLIV